MLRRKLFCILCIITLFCVGGCATQTQSVNEMWTAATEEGLAVVGTLHGERTQRGIHFNLGPEGSTFANLFAGSDKWLFNLNVSPLGDDAFHWEHVETISGSATGLDATVQGRTRIRIDRPEYLGPLSE